MSVTGVIKILTAVAAALELVVEQIRAALRRKEKADVQASSDSIDFDPAGEFMRRYKRGQVPADTKTELRKHDEE